MEAKKDNVSVIGGKGAAKPQKRAEWGIYVYFAADVPDPDMQTAVQTTLRTLASVGSTDDIKITAMIDLPCRKTEYYIIPPKPRSEDYPMVRSFPTGFCRTSTRPVSVQS